MMGEWVIESLAMKQRAKEALGSDVLEDEEERVKPPLHTVKKGD
jgi:hypothetical protein